MEDILQSIKSVIRGGAIKPTTTGVSIELRTLLDMSRTLHAIAESYLLSEVEDLQITTDRENRTIYIDEL